LKILLKVAGQGKARDAYDAVIVQKSAAPAPYVRIFIMKKVLIAGGGAAGLMAAVFAAREGAEVSIFEKEGVPGRKLSASGNGRCNITNNRAAPESYFAGREAVSAALSSFGVEKTKAFFENLGLPLKEEDEGRIFPRCERAPAVLNILKDEAERLGVKIVCGSGVNSARRTQSGFEISAGGTTFKADSLVLACGSCAYPQIGGAEEGYRLSKSLGHTVTPLTPSLVPLAIKEKSVARLSGIRTQARLTAFCGSAEIASSRGEILFANYGLSGPAALNLSRECVRRLKEGRISVSINLFPEYQEREAEQFLTRRWEQFSSRPVKRFFLGLLHESVSNLVMDMTGLDRNAVCSASGPGAMERVRKALLDWHLEVTGHRPWNEAMVCAGGVPVSEIDPENMRSLKTPGLFLAGELLDVDGPTGGYNLQFAWSSGMLAGTFAAR